MGILGKSPWSAAQSDSLPKEEFLTAWQRGRNSKIEMPRAEVGMRLSGGVPALHVRGPGFDPKR